MLAAGENRPYTASSACGGRRPAHTKGMTAASIFLQPNCVDGAMYISEDYLNNRKTALVISSLKVS